MPRTRTLVTIEDLESTMGRKADHVGQWIFDPETGGFKRSITFKIKPKKKRHKRIAAAEREKS
jgi:hypothetical protein